MTLATYQPTGNGLALHQPPQPPERTDTIARLGEWAQSAQAAHSIAVNLVETSFVPQHFRGKPAEATAAILAGAELGLNPMASLKSFSVIQGTATANAITLRAVVQAAGHEVRVVESTETRAIVEGRRRGEQSWQKSTWTLDRATKMGLTGKDNWKKQPGAMLVARATSEVCRWIGADAIAGIPYSAEEIADGADGSFQFDPQPEQAAAAAPKTRTVRRAPVKATTVPTAVEPDFDDEPAAVAEPVSGPPADGQAAEKMTRPQQGKMHALFGQVDIADRDDRMRYVNEVLAEAYGPDRQVTSSADLSKDEAGKVIDALEAFAGQSEPPADPS